MRLCVCVCVGASVSVCVCVCVPVFVVDSVAFFLASQLGHVYIELLVGPRDVQRFSVWAMAFSCLLYGFAKSIKLYEHNCMINLRLLAINFHSDPHRAGRSRYAFAHR